MTGERDARATQDDVLQARDELVLHHPLELPGREVAAGERGVRSLLDVLPDLGGAGAVAGEELFGAVSGAREVLLDPDALRLLGAREVAAAADGAAGGRDRAGAVQQAEHDVGERLAERTEGRPLATDQAHERDGALLVDLDAVVARHETGCGVL